MKTVYFAGPLFTHSELDSNVRLAKAMEEISSGRYKFILPQDSECNKERTQKEIRDDDLMNVINCDMAIFNFNGTEVDSGTVVEFMKAKEVDKPSVIYRTDFRNAGDDVAGDSDSGPWNLMLSGYPRVATVVRHGMNDYHGAIQSGLFKSYIYTNTLAEQLVAALDKVAETEPVFKPHEQEMIRAWAIRSAGKSLEVLASQQEMEATQRLKDQMDEPDISLALGI